MADDEIYSTDFPCVTTLVSPLVAFGCRCFRSMQNLPALVVPIRSLSGALKSGFYERSWGSGFLQWQLQVIATRDPTGRYGNEPD